MKILLETIAFLAFMHIPIQACYTVCISRTFVGVAWVELATIYKWLDDGHMPVWKCW